MSNYDYIKEIAKYGLENDQEQLVKSLQELISYSRKVKKGKFALQLQSILKSSKKEQKPGLTHVGSKEHFRRIEEKEVSELILEKLISEYNVDDLVCPHNIKFELELFIREHESLDILKRFKLPVANKVILHGPSGCGKTLASYVISGELGKTMYVVNLGAVVSSKLGETSKNLSKVFRRAASEESILFFDEFDSIGKIRDYDQDHGEMKRVVNTILQLIDYLPQSSIVICATNQIDMIDEALLRRFDLNIKFELPAKEQIKELIDITLKNASFKFDDEKSVERIIDKCVGLSYYSVQKTLINSLKRSVLLDNESDSIPISGVIRTEIWNKLVGQEKKALAKN